MSDLKSQTVTSNSYYSELAMPIWHFKFLCIIHFEIANCDLKFLVALIISYDKFFTTSNPKRKRANLRTAYHLYKFFANDFRSAAISVFTRSFCNISCSSCGTAGDTPCDISPFGVAFEAPFIYIILSSNSCSLCTQTNPSYRIIFY